jgi:ABC-2 type transport system ATP-binding protein
VSAVIEIEGLRKDYRQRRKGAVHAVDGLDLSVAAGGVFGFLGPNGSGKTTTIRCLLGLARPSGGSCRILGSTVPKELSSVIRRIGALVETPGLNPGLTPRQNARVAAELVGIGASRVAEVLDLMDLSERADDSVKGFSLGMRQRLGIAIALLRDPEVLVLDEPANGLDPAGIREIRQLIRRLGDEGRTVFLSSHLLDEVEQVCDHIAIVSRGRTVASGTVREVLRGGASNTTFVRVTKPVVAQRALKAAAMESTRDGNALRVVTPRKGPAEIARVLAGSDVFPSELRPDEADLEDVFLRLTSEPPEPA